MFTNLLGRFSTATAGAPQRRTVALIAALALVALAAALSFAVGPTADAGVAIEPAELPPTGAGPALAPAPLLDHSVVQSQSLADEPDMTGASVGAY